MSDKKNLTRKQKIALNIIAVIYFIAFIILIILGVIPHPESFTP